jgi:hypothetical protein
MRLTAFLCSLAFIAFTPAHGATLTFLNTTDGGSTFHYSGSVQNNQQVESGNYFVIFDFAGLLSGDGPSSSWVFSTQADVAGQPDNPSVSDALFTYTGSPITGAPGNTSLGIFTLRTTATQQQQGSYVFETTRSNGGNAGNSVDQSSTTTVAFNASAVPEPGAMMLVGGGLLAVCLSRFRRRISN